MDSQCLRVREWIHSRSKAYLTDKTLADLKKENSLDANFTRGLGVFGNNKELFRPSCLSTKYFNWIQEIMHPSRELPLYIIKEDGTKSDDPKFSTRAYCCCTDMRTGEIFDNDPVRNCKEMIECDATATDPADMLYCQHAFDAKIWGEIFKEREKDSRQ